MTIEEINKQCPADKKDKLNHDSISEYYFQLQDYMSKHENENISNEDYYLRAIYNPDLIQHMKNLMKMIQDCLNKEEHLNPEELGKVISRLLAMHANRQLKGKLQNRFTI